MMVLGPKTWVDLYLLKVDFSLDVVLDRSEDAAAAYFELLHHFFTTENNPTSLRIRYSRKNQTVFYVEIFVRQGKYIKKI